MALVRAKRAGTNPRALAEALVAALPAAPPPHTTAMELAGHKPLLVRGRESNLKVTYPEDLPLAEFWLSRQEYAR